MELFVIRHATAIPRSGDLEDADRPLSPRGRKRFAPVAKGLVRLDVQLDRLYHSPWLRALETAEMLAPLAAETVVTPNLATSPAESLLAELEGDRIGLVGHEPWMSELVAWLTTGRRDGAAYVFKKGGVAWLEGEPAPAGMILRAFLPPRFLRGAQ